ncbi:MAG: type IV pilus assembly protein PilM [Deltaproteobacteria bacterium]|jgi:type IV pilus assembly protein PilM|nr:type IV pilus assembly protein PilM [Deltaproteobacteria bacterium]
MAFGKKDHIVGLDIGSRSIKAAEITETKRGLSLTHFGIVDIAHGAIEEGTINDPETVAESIKQLFKSYNIKENNVAVSIGGYSVIVKKISVQTMDEEKLQETIHFEAEQYIPFDISDVNLDFQILGESESNPGQMNVFLVAAKKEMVNDYINLVNLAGLNPCIVDVEAFALQNTFEANYDMQSENTALIDIGASKTSLNILKGNSSLFMRDVSLGCGQINQKIMSLIECSFEEAEQLKYGDKPDRLTQEDLKGIVSSVVTDWCTEIRRALDFFYSTYPEDQIKRIILSGGGANIDEFRELLAAEASAEVESSNPFKNLTKDKKNFDDTFIKQIAPQAAISMGLAMRKVDDK